MITRRRWEAGTNVIEMLNSAYEFSTDRGRYPERDRKIRLYLTACCRQFWDELPWVSRMTTELAEEVADGLFDAGQLARLLKFVAEERVMLPTPTSLEVKLTDLLNYIAEGVMYCLWNCGVVGEIPVPCIRDYERYLLRAGFVKPDRPECWPTDIARMEKLSRLAYMPHGSPGSGTAFDFVPAELYSIPLLHDVFSLFPRIEFRPPRRTDAVYVLADAMYAARDFAAMPVLADALEEAGCDQPDILVHCRGPGPHVRGCWVVDLVLGKS